ncbi:thioredoxin family protein [Cryobacterium sp. PH31-AA6]|uniref:thioredoxin family protein n=1 Tax=Cryobacterium sp. PH31-AA6 TaxID=3046205 RepID=UPI0024B92BD8|nr:thioredoxin family protein [Cryobacterium sp. PH31-AA6]MDJ0324768.1 thioredoxin family protein [Cryobacterium sp. PH31-AA6]
MNIKILGPGCRNCVNLTKAATTAVRQLGLDATIEKVEDYAAIAGYGVMSTPALVINDKVVVSGRVPTLAEVRTLLSSAAV